MCKKAMVFLGGAGVGLFVANYLTDGSVVDAIKDIFSTSTETASDIVETIADEATDTIDNIDYTV